MGHTLASVCSTTRTDRDTLDAATRADAATSSTHTRTHNTATTVNSCNPVCLGHGMRTAASGRRHHPGTASGLHGVQVGHDVPHAIAGNDQVLVTGLGHDAARE